MSDAPTGGAPTVGEARDFILEFFGNSFEALGMTAQNVPDDFDLLLEGIIDSFGIIELLTALEGRFGVVLDLEQMNPDDVSVLGPLAREVAQSFPSTSK